MDDLTPSRSLDNIFSQDEDEFLNMIFSNSSLNETATPSPANGSISPIEQVPLPSTLTEQQIEEDEEGTVPSSAFFFNGDSTTTSTTEPTLVEDVDPVPSSSPIVSSSIVDLPLLLPVKPELVEDEEPLFSTLPDIFPTIEEVGTPDSDELSDAMSTTSSSSSSPTSPNIKKEVKMEKKKKTQTKTTKPMIKEEKKKRAGKQNKRDTRPGKKQKTDNLSPFIRSLKGMNSQQLEEYASTRNLTSQQQSELKDWIRKIKNRESASNSRKNRKSHQQVLEAQLEELDTRNEELQEEIKELEIENRVLRGELVKFRTLIEQSNLGQAFEEYNRRNKARALALGGGAATKATASSAVTSKVTPTVASPKLPVATAPVPRTDSEGNLGVDEGSSPLKADVPAENDASAIATPTATLPTGTKDQIESYRAQTLARLGEAVAKMVQKGKARREDVALVLYLLIVLHQCGQFLTTPAQLAQQMGIPSSEAVSVVV